MTEKDITRIWLTTEAIHIATTDGREGKELFADYDHLRTASPAQLAAYEVWGGGIHWPELDEDLCFEGFFSPKPQTALYVFFKAHPELNAAAFARRLGISQSLFAQYISGAKKPTPARSNAIQEELHNIGQSLVCATI